LSLIELLAPARCAACLVWIEAGTGDVLCRPCWRALPWLARGGRCLRCQDELPRAWVDGPRESELCLACEAEPSPLDACLAAVAYRGAAEDWIRRFKYPAAGLAGMDPAPAAVMAAIARALARRAPDPAADCIVPIPLHIRRARARGFNPAALLAREIARACRLPLRPTGLRRLRDTPSQTGLDRGERRLNVADAFECTRLRVAGATPVTVWLVDDVVTTGATLREAAQCLSAHGVTRVVGLCIARTPLRAGTEQPSSSSG